MLLRALYGKPFPYPTPGLQRLVKYAGRPTRRARRSYELPRRFSGKTELPENRAFGYRRLAISQERNADG